MIKKLLAAATAAVALQGSALAQGSIKIGVPLVEAGPLAFIMTFYQESIKAAVDTLNAQGGALGRKYEVVTQTHAGTPATAIAAVTRLTQQDGVPFILGFSTSPMSLAIGPRLAGLNALQIDVSSTSDDVTGKGCATNMFRTSVSDAMQVNALKGPVKKLGLKTWNIIVPDYAMGHDFAKRFAASVQETGATVQTTLFAPLGTPDFGSFINQLASKPAEGLAVVIIGSDAINFAKQAKQFGMFEKYKGVVAANFTNEVVLGAQGDATVGVATVQGYTYQFPSPRNEAMVKLWDNRFKRKPNYLEAEAYLGVEVLHAAIVKAGSTDLAAVRSALVGLKTNTIVGDVEMRGDHQLARPMVSMQIERAGEGKATTVFKNVEPTASVMPVVSPECKL
ncbi:MAG: ABC transporter substrate-binding protein [Burkholderiales bacterium]